MKVVKMERKHPWDEIKVSVPGPRVYLVYFPGFRNFCRRLYENIHAYVYDPKNFKGFEEEWIKECVDNSLFLIRGKSLSRELTRLSFSFYGDLVRKLERIFYDGECTLYDVIGMSDKLEKYLLYKTPDPEDVSVIRDINGFYMYIQTTRYPSIIHLRRYLEKGRDVKEQLLKSLKPERWKDSVGELKRNKKIKTGALEEILSCFNLGDEK